MAVVLGLAVALSYGTADFFGGLASKRSPTAGVVLFSQLLGLAAILAISVLTADVAPGRDLALGAAAGLLGCCGLVALYRGLASGRMSVVAPITAAGAAIVPVVWGLATGERPSPPAWVGVVLAIVAIVLVSRPAEDDGEQATAGVPIAIAAGAAFGIVFVLLGETSDDAGLWPLVAGRAASTTAMLIVAAVTQMALRPHPADARTIAGAGVFDVTANALYLVASRRGLLSLVAVLSSLYPAATVVLARVVLGERIGPMQRIGLVAAAAGVVLIATG